MRRLTPTEIEALASRPNVRRIAVENFLISFPLDLPMPHQFMNLYADTLAYQWTPPTVQAIRDGLNLANGEVYDA